MCPKAREYAMASSDTSAPCVIEYEYVCFACLLIAVDGNHPIPPIQRD